MGRVYWITGLSGAGKTTIGKLLYETLRTKKQNVVFLDGDTLREVFGNDLGYSPQERKESAMRNSRLCKLLSEQGLDVICCTISMFDSVRDWNKANLAEYIEVYVKVSMETLYKRNQKNLYKSQSKHVVGLDLTVEEPKKPTVIIQNEGDMTPQKAVEQLLRL